MAVGWGWREEERTVWGVVDEEGRVRRTKGGGWRRRDEAEWNCVRRGSGSPTATANEAEADGGEGRRGTLRGRENAEMRVEERRKKQGTSGERGIAIEDVESVGLAQWKHLGGGGGGGGGDSAGVLGPPSSLSSPLADLPAATSLRRSRRE